MKIKKKQIFSMIYLENNYTKARKEWFYENNKES